MSLRTIIVGLGKIGLLYNYSNSNNNSNHSDIFSSTNGFKLVGGVEIIKKKRLLFERKFSKPSFKNLNHAYKKTNPDILVLSVPITKFNNIYKYIFLHKIKPKVFVIEKPGATNVGELIKMFNYCKRNKINIIMNYTRDFSKELKNFSNYLKVNKIGKLIKINLYYKKGFFNTCGHFISFLRNFYKFNKASKIKIISCMKKNHDYYASFKIKLNTDLNFFLVRKNMDEKINIVGTKGKIEYITEKHLVNFFSNGKRIKIKNDFSKDLKNMISFIKINFNNRLKCYKIFDKYILTLKILNQICQKILNYKFKKFNTYNHKEVKAALKVVKTGHLSGFIADNSKSFYGGQHVNRLEKSFAKYFKTKFAISVNSWTSGLVCAVGALNICPGDEIIVTPWTMTATATAILAWGGIPVFSEIDMNTYCLDPSKIEEKINSKTRAIISVDIFGQSSEYKNIIRIAKKYNLKVISDTAQAIGSKHFNKFTGTISDIGGFSLNRHKHIQTGEGGIIITNNKKLAENMIKIRNHGEVLNKDKNFRNLIGFNFRMGEIEAAIGLEQLKKLKKIVKKKQETANILTKKLSVLPGIKTPYIMPGNTHVYYGYPLQLTNKKLFTKKKYIFNSLKAEGVPLEDDYDGFLLRYFIYKNPKIKKNFPWKLSKKKKILPKNNSIYKNIDSLIRLRFLNIPYCEYDFSKKDISKIVKAFYKVWKTLDL